MTDCCSQLECGAGGFASAVPASGNRLMSGASCINFCECPGGTGDVITIAQDLKGTVVLGVTAKVIQASDEDVDLVVSDSSGDIGTVDSQVEGLSSLTLTPAFYADEDQLKITLSADIATGAVCFYVAFAAMG